MLKKLMNGEIKLRDTFWMFGFLGLPVLSFVTKIVGRLLVHKLGKTSILAYFVSIGRKVELSTSILTILYLSLAGFLIFYCIALLLGVWKSSAEYDRSLWFRYLSRIFMVIMVFLALKVTFKL